MIAKLTNFIRKESKSIRFVLVFAILFFTGMGLKHYYIQDIDPFVGENLYANAVVSVINIVVPDEQAKSKGAVVFAGKRPVYKVTEECEGLESFLLLSSAVVAFSLGLRATLIGLFGSALVVYCFNMLRLFVLYYILRVSPDFFEPVHIYIGPLFSIFPGIIFFIVWVMLFTKSRSPDESEAHAA